MDVNLTEWAGVQGVAPRTAYRWFREGTLPVPAERVGPRTILVNIEANTAPQKNGGRSKACRLLTGPELTAVVVEHQNCLGRMNVELVEAVLSEAAEHG